MIQPAAPTSIVREFGGRFICYGCRMIAIADTMADAYSGWLRMVQFNQEKRA